MKKVSKERGNEGKLVDWYGGFIEGVKGEDKAQVFRLGWRENDKCVKRKEQRYEERGMKRRWRCQRWIDWKT